MIRNYDWDAVRYVLEDPSLDRSECEARMLNDETFALAVADAVLMVDDLRRVCAVASAPVVMTSSSESMSAMVHADSIASVHPNHWNSWCILAAVLMLAVGLCVHYSSHEDSSLDHAVVRATHSKQAVADHWLAMSGEGVEENSASESSIEDPRESVSWSTRDTTTSELDNADESDWMIEAAREFYAEGVAS